MDNKQTVIKIKSIERVKIVYASSVYIRVARLLGIQ